MRAPRHPSPALKEGLERLRRRSGEQDFRTRLELLVYELPPSEADALMMLMKESRGAWALLLSAVSGRVLFVGDALSGTPLALVTLGFDVTVVDTCWHRSWFAVDRGEDLAPGSTAAIQAGADPKLPFVDQAFSVTVLEGGLPSPKTGWGFGLDELRRVTGAELVVTADNRLGYKRSTGRRGAFRRDPRFLLVEVLSPARGEATLPTTKALVQGPQGEWPTARAFSLYPHALEFSHVVALDEARPQLTIGPRERTNRIKMIGHRLGLFPWLTPSFAIHTRRAGQPPLDRLTRILRQLSEMIGEDAVVADVLVATRSNDALIHTAHASGKGPAGRWTLHVPLQPSKRNMVATHHDWIVKLQRDLPDVPVPEPLFNGELEGTQLSAERRLGGLTGTDITGDLKLTERMLIEAARHTARLVDRDTTLLDDAWGERLFRPRFDRVERVVRTESTLRRLRALRSRVEERLIGSRTRLAIYHADLRGKHVQMTEEGAVTGYLDWGASEASFVPFIDLLHLVIHQRKQEVGGAFGDAWRALLDPASRRDYENAAFEGYLQHTGFDEDDLKFYLETYPLFIAGMAERNWDYSRPDWVRRQFGIE